MNSNESEHLIAKQQETAFPLWDFGKLLTIEEVSLLFNVPKSWVYERTRNRGSEKLPYIKLGKYIRFEESAIRKFLENQRKSTHIM